MAKINKLTDSFLKSIKCESDKKFIKFADPSLKGLYVFVGGKIKCPFGKIKCP
ncbi:hypothetical protein ACX9BX_001085 [Campylobacter jejuni]